MSRSADKMDLSPQAKKLIEQHTRAIESQTDETLKKLTSAATVIAASCAVLNLRSRYIGAAGEHFSVQEYEGIQVVDALDERLLRSLKAILSAYAERARKKPDPKALELLETKLTPGAKELPQYPVGYVVHFMLFSAIQAFDPLAEEGHGFEVPVLETAMVHHLLGILARYVTTREKPVTRHFSDVAREYSVVMRLKCQCGAEKFDVKLQALCQSPAGEPYDRLDLQCKDCGTKRSITFDLPHFKDMYQI
ncbi:MAG TPA: hypothetical protein VMU54_06565 [Planctomycetota bacterium]|nr:hypothetical protein [Planctomycetota bacterium]